MYIQRCSRFVALSACAALFFMSTPAFAQVAQIPLAECPDRAESTRVASEARRLQRERNLPAAMAAWDRAIALCALPDRFEGRARTGEALQGERDGEERLALLDRVITDYTQAIQRRGYVVGFNSAPIEAALPPLRLARETLERRVHPTTTNVVSNSPVAPPVTPVAVSRPNVVISHVVPPPVVIPPVTPSPSRTLPRAFWISGATATVVGMTLGIVGHTNATARDDNAALIALPVSQRCRTVNGHTQCLGLTSDQQSQVDTLASLEVPGWIVAGVGLAAVVTGVILEVRANHSVTERPPAAEVRPSLAFDQNGTPLAGIRGTFF